VGEQYINLSADKDEGPYLADGGNLPVGQNKLPISTQVFLNSLNNVAMSIDPAELKGALKELSLAFSDRGPDLGTIADSVDTLVTAALQNLPQTQALIQSSTTVLQTQLAEGSAIQTFAKNINELSQTLSSSNGDVQSLLNSGPDGFAAVRTFVKNNQSGLGTLFANLTTTGQVIVAHLGGLQEVLTLLPIALVDGLASTSNNTLKFGFVSPNTGKTTVTDKSRIGPWCVAGYTPMSNRRNSADTGPRAADTSARCTDNTTLPRGATNTPDGDPVTTGGGGTPYPRAITDNVLRVGQVSQPNAAALGDNAWLTIFTSSMH
jgi:phospholipid/cholesterol/gamma-HCH transport system substrate-binding protein